jgi:hypothetical protein
MHLMLHGWPYLWHLYVLDAFDVTNNFYASIFKEKFPGDGTCSYTANSFARARAATASNCADSVLGVIRSIGVARPVCDCHSVIVLTALILISNEHCYGSADGDSIDDARQNFHRVLLISRRDDPALARATTVQLDLDVVTRKSKARRASVYGDTYSAAVRLAPRGYPEDAAEGVA